MGCRCAWAISQQCYAHLWVGTYYYLLVWWSLINLAWQVLLIMWLTPCQQLRHATTTFPLAPRLILHHRRAHGPVLISYGHLITTRHSLSSRSPARHRAGRCS